MPEIVFAQAANYDSHVHAIYFDPDYAMKKVEYRESNRNPLVSIGPEIDYEPVRGIRIAVRPGKDFGDNFAANTAPGFSINGGVLFDAERTGRTVGLRNRKRNQKDLSLSRAVQKFTNVFLGH